MEVNASNMGTHGKFELGWPAQQLRAARMCMISSYETANCFGLLEHYIIGVDSVVCILAGEQCDVASYAYIHIYLAWPAVMLLVASSF